MLVTAFGGGILAAAIGALPSFVLTGLTVLVAAIAGEFGAPIISTLSFGSFFGPHVAFAGAVGAAAYAGQRQLIDNGSDITIPLFKTGDPMTLMVGGAFGVVGFLICYLLSDVIGAKLFHLSNWTDSVAMTVVITGIIARLMFTKSGLFGKIKNKEERLFFPKGKRLSFLIVIGFGIGIVIGGLTASLGQLADGSASLMTVFPEETIAKSALYLFKNSGNIGFGIAAVALIFLCMGKPIEAFHHIILTAATSAMIVYAGINNAILAIIAGAVMGVLAAILGEVVGLFFNTNVQSHIDPPAFTIAVLQIFNLCLLARLIPAAGVFA